ncbi:MAG: hypothetical protein WC352_05175 [Candidatus Omnitrophota bacterium]|jgi:hypothetical protein
MNLSKMPRPSGLLGAGVRIMILGAVVVCALWCWQKIQESLMLRQIIERLSADSRIAEVLVTKSEYDEADRKIHTTIKFLEYDARQKPLAPKYFTFRGNVIQFQALVLRFDEKFVKAGDPLRGKSVCLFLKAFVLDGAATQVFDITRPDEIPEGYKIPGSASKFEAALWERFWSYALDPKARKSEGIRNAQIEAPGSMFLPGTIYTLRIEHDGGIRIDTEPVPEILRGETIHDV